MKIFKVFKKRLDSFLKRRPHRSFRRTYRRDYVRSLKLPGYIKFTKYVNNIFWKNRKIFASLILTYAILTILLIGIASQDLYATIKDTLNQTSGDLFSGAFSEVGKAGLLFLSALTGSVSVNMTDSQSIIAGLITLMAWLTTIWLLRNILAGHKVNLRDGLYSAGAPILSTFVIVLIMILQLLPLALVVIGYVAAMMTGLLDGGVEAMLFWIASILLSSLSLYLITSTFFALIISTLPGMYPFKAIKVSGDLVVGRRLRLLKRILWLAFILLITWAIIVIPMILFDGWIKYQIPAIEWLPVIPILLLIMSSTTVVYSSGYIYLLYRKVVADESEPA